jgi:hypothetical protein
MNKTLDIALSWVKSIFILVPVACVLLVCWWYLGNFYWGITWSIMSWIYDAMIGLGFVFPWGWIWGIALVLVQLCSAIVLPPLTFLIVLTGIMNLVTKD